MSSDLKAEATIELETSSLQTNSDKVQKEFDEIGDSAKQAGSDIAGATAKAEGELDSLGSSGKKAGSDVKSGADKGSSGLKNMDAAASSADAGLTTLAVTAIGLGQSITGVTDAIFGFQEKVVALERSTFGLKQLTVEVTRQEEDLTEALQSGTLSMREQTRQTENLAFAYEALAIEGRTVTAEQQALNGEYVTFGINTAGVIFQLGIAILAFKTHTAVVALNTPAVNANTASKAVNTGVTATLTGVTLGAVAATKALTITMLASPLAPFAIAAIGAGAAFVALNDDIGGVRSSIEDLTGSGKGSMATLGFSITGLGEDFKDTGDDMEDWAGQAQEVVDLAGGEGGLIPTIDLAAESISAFNTVLSPDGINALSAFNGSLEVTTKMLIPFANGIFDASGNLIDMSKHLGNNNKVLDIWGRAILDSSSKLVTETNLLAANTNALQENSKAVEENLKKNDELTLAINQFFSANGTLNTITQASGVPTTQGLVTQEFFSSLPPELTGGFTPTSGPGISVSTLLKQSQAKAFKNSIEGITTVVLSNIGRRRVSGGFKANVLAGTSGGALDRTQAEILQSLGSGFFTEIINAQSAGLFSFDPIAFLRSGGSFGELRSIAAQLNRGEEASATQAQELAAAAEARVAIDTARFLARTQKELLLTTTV